MSYADVRQPFAIDFAKHPGLEPAWNEPRSLLKTLLTLQSDILETIQEAVDLKPADRAPVQVGNEVLNLNIIASTSSNGQRIDWLTSEWAAFCVHSHVQQIITSNLCWTSPNLTVPHLLVELGTMPGTDRLLLYLAMVPKRDVSYEYVTTYYSKRPSTTVPRSWEELAAHCLMIPGWTAWRSKTASVNCMGAGLACAHLIPAADVEMAGDIAKEAVNLWLGFLCSATPLPDGEDVMAMATRDAGLRRMNTYGDPYFQALKEVVGGDAWDAMSGLISKGEEEYGIV